MLKSIMKYREESKQIGRTYKNRDSKKRMIKEKKVR